MKWYRLAAEQGDSSSSHMFAKIYLNGNGVIQDYIRAHMWFNLAARKGEEKARENREEVTKTMTLSQIAEAQKMARDCEKKKSRF